MVAPEQPTFIRAGGWGRCLVRGCGWAPTAATAVLALWRVPYGGALGQKHGKSRGQGGFDRPARADDDALTGEAAFISWSSWVLSANPCWWPAHPGPGTRSVYLESTRERPIYLVEPIPSDYIFLANAKRQCRQGACSFSPLLGQPDLPPRALSRPRRQQSW